MSFYTALRKGGQSPLVQRARRAQYEGRRFLSAYPGIYLPVVRRMHPAGEGKVLADDTEIVIDGFTRSACTFAVLAFQMAQPAPVRVARHLHAPAHLIAAARAGIPALVPVREPRATILSAVVREPHVTIPQALRSYESFYSRLIPYRSHFVISPFEEVTTSFGNSIRRVNDKFGTSFQEFVHTEESVARVFDMIEVRSRGHADVRRIVADFQSGLVGLDELTAVLKDHPHAMSGAPVGETFVARPSETRNTLKEQLAAQWEARELNGLRARAMAAYDEFAQLEPQVAGLAR